MREEDDDNNDHEVLGMEVGAKPQPLTEHYILVCPTKGVFIGMDVKTSTFQWSMIRDEDEPRAISAVAFKKEHLPVAESVIEFLKSHDLSEGRPPDPYFLKRIMSNKKHISPEALARSGFAHLLGKLFDSMESPSKTVH